MSGRLPWLAVLAAALVVVPAPALGYHNSVGAHVNVVQVDEVETGEDGGALTPDVPASLEPTFHPELDTPRPAPSDQSGSAYRPADGCTPWSVFEGSPDARTDYEEALEAGTACYVGYMEAQLEYMVFTQIFSVDRTEDVLYPANPEDEECLGETGEPECSGANHPQKMPGYLMIETSFVESPYTGTEVAGADVPGLADATGQPTGSGPLALPFFVTPYVLLFGEPHPSRPADAVSDHEAGEGFFDQPTLDLEGACGERTDECRLLQPADVRRYDDPDRTPPGVGAGPAAEQARVCQLTPAFGYEHPLPERGGPCGPFGRVMDQFIGNMTAGGFDTETVNTWQSNAPGWYRAAVMATPGTMAGPVDAVDQFASDPKPSTFENDATLREYKVPPSDDTDGRTDPGFWQAFAVNPAVPSAGGPLWCLTPGILATGDDEALGGADPGVHGAYIADAIDLDVHPRIAHQPQQAAVDAVHEPLRGAIATAEDLAAGSEQDTPLPDELEAAFQDALQRADPVQRNVDGEATVTREFTLDRGGEVACTAEGELSTEAAGSVRGGLRVDARLQTNTGNPHNLPSTPQTPGVKLEDPTAGDEPLPPEDAEEAPWRHDVYSVHGRIASVLDANRNDALDPCTGDFAEGEPDVCRWEAIWDAYNTACTDADGTACGDVLRQRGYDPSEGVGVYFVLEVTGPVLVYQAREANLPAGAPTFVGDGDTAQRQCIVGTSLGFTPELIDRRDGVDTREDLLDELCDVEGERMLFEDAFDTQTADEHRVGARVDPGDVVSSLRFVPLAPTPHAATEVTGLGQGDRLCLTGVFAVQDGETASDTEGGLDLEGTDNVFTDCDTYGR